MSDPSPPGILLGAYVQPRGPQTDAGKRAAVVDHEATIGRRLALVNEFFSFDKPWPLDRLKWHLDSGRGLMISWNGTGAAEVLSGDVDHIIRERAQWVLELDTPLLLRFFWEPDAAKGRTWGYHDDPTLYHRVWDHVRAIFAEEGVGNARWVWTPTTWHFTTGNAPAFYPGDDAVDLIGVDGYLWSPCLGDSQSVEEIFGDFLDWAAARPQPIVISEWGADADPSSKADFVDELHALAARTERLFALVVFDSTDPGDRGCDWRIDTSSEALEAYRRLATDPRLSGGAERIADL